MFRFFSMRVFSGWRIFAFLALGLMIAGTRVEAQSFGLSVTGSANPVLLNSNLTYTIYVTNSTLINLPDTLVTNTLAGSLQVLGGSTSQGGVTTNGNFVIFDLGYFPINGIAQLAVNIQPTALGTVADTVQVVSLIPAFTASTAIVTTVTNASQTAADLAVAINAPTTAIFANDWMVYGVNVTNLGPNSAPSVYLTNTLPTGVGFKSVSPSNQSFTVSIQNSNVIFNLGMLTNQAFMNFQLTVQPTNAGILPFMSTVNTNSGVLDPNLANNVATVNIPVLNYPAGQLSATIVSTQQYNPQNGLVEQSILVSNVGTNAVAAARVVLTGLTNKLYNALGTNNGNPFVVDAASLDTNQSVFLLLQYVAGNYFPLTNAQLNAFPVAVPNLTPPPVSSVSNTLNITRILHLATNGDVLIEFPSITNRTYTVVYSDNVLFSNAMVAAPSIVAPANRTQWIDYGPPTTVSHPTNAPLRFYRVLLNP